MRVIEPDDSFSRGYSPPGTPQWASKTSDEEFTLELRFNVPANMTDLGLNRAIVGVTSAVGSQLPAAMGAALRQAGHALLSAQVQQKPIEQLIGNRELIPWLPWDDRMIAGSRTTDLDRLAAEHFSGIQLVGRKLAGFKVPLGDVFIAEKIVRPGQPFAALPLLNLELLSLSFEAGSIKAILKGVGKGVAGISVFLSLAYIEPQVTKLINHETAVYQAHEVVAKLVGSQKDAFCVARLSFDGLEDARERSLNYREKGISDEERRCRTAQSQALLAVGLNIDLDIDGQAGGNTHEAERAFAHMHNLTCTDCPEFRGRLAQVIDDLIAKKEGQSKES